MLSLFGVLVFALGAALPPNTTHQRPAGFVVLHFPAAESEGACQQQVEQSGRARTLFQGYRMTDGEVLTIKGHVAIRFKASTSAAQIDSLIAATGTEAYSASARGCRRYALRVLPLEDDPITIAKTLQESGLVEYATPDFSAGRSEGLPTDSLFIDQLALSDALEKSGAAAAAAPPAIAAPSNYGMGQVLSEYIGPLMRVDAPAISAQLSSANSSASALALVRSHGITTLRLDIPERTPLEKVRVTIYALNGTPIRQLVSDALEAGRYIVGWDALDDRGRRVQPGVYVAVMTAGNFSEKHRLVVR